MSLAQDTFEAKLRKCTDLLNLSLLTEKNNKEKTTIILPNNSKHIVDFLIPELNFFIEYSGNNYLPKLITMKLAHSMKDINYFSLIEIRYKRLKLPKIAEQEQQLFQMITDNINPIEISKISHNRLNNLISTFNSIIQGEITNEK